MGIGIISGFLSGLLGIGGGIILIPALTIWCKQDPKISQGTALLVIPFAALGGLLNYYFTIDINLNYSLWLASGSMIGIFIGAHLAYKLNSKILNKLLALFIIIIGIKMFIG